MNDKIWRLCFNPVNSSGQLEGGLMSSNLSPPIWRRLFGTRGRNLTSSSYILLQRRPRFLMAWNIFKHCSGLRVLGCLMILLVAAIVCVSHYAVIIIVCGPRLFRGGSEGIITSFIVIIFHILLIMVIWCYSMVVLTDPGSVPQNWRPMVDEEDAEVQVPPTCSSLPPEVNAIIFSESLVGGMGQIPGLRYCNKCHNYKPPRCHHCSVCQRCILKMDHHCVWVVNCVGACNYKFFLLFLLYTFLVTTLDTFVLLPHFLDFFKDVGKHSGSPSNLAVTFLAFILNVAFALSLLGFLIMHASLLSTNTTTVEVYEKKNSTKWRYDLGRRKNFEQVFGTRMLYWLIPLYAGEDIASMPVLRGLDFPVRPDLDGWQ